VTAIEELNVSEALEGAVFRRRETNSVDLTSLGKYFAELLLLHIEWKVPNEDCVAALRSNASVEHRLFRLVETLQDLQPSLSSRPRLAVKFKRLLELTALGELDVGSARSTTISTKRKLDGGDLSAALEKIRDLRIGCDPWKTFDIDLVNAACSLSGLAFSILRN
jgi:hypothetical protein